MPSAEERQIAVEQVAEELALWKQAFSDRLSKFEQALEENTKATKRVDENTKEVVDILQSWKGAAKVMNFLASLAKPIGALLVFGASLWAAWPAKK